MISKLNKHDGKRAELDSIGRERRLARRLVADQAVYDLRFLTSDSRDLHSRTCRFGVDEHEDPEDDNIIITTYLTFTLSRHRLTNVRYIYLLFFHPCPSKTGAPAQKFHSRFESPAQMCLISGPCSLCARRCPRTPSRRRRSFRCLASRGARSSPRTCGLDDRQSSRPSSRTATRRSVHHNLRVDSMNKLVTRYCTLRI